MSIIDSIKSAISDVSSAISNIGINPSGTLKSDGNPENNLIAKLQELSSQAQTMTRINLNKININLFSSPEATSQWSKTYPYRFLIVKISNNKPETVAAYRLPINPQDLTIQMPFATNLTVTSGGILEEHNGIPLRHITISGTTGVYLGRETRSDRSDVVGTIFGNTIDAFKDFSGSASRTVENFQNLFVSGQSANKYSSDNINTDNLQKSGYFQYHMMRLFLETYADLKKSANGNGYRLVFEMAKDKLSYFVTPRAMVTKRSATSPMEYLYTIQLTAWGTYDPTSFGNTANVTVDIGTTRRLFNALKQARSTVNKFKNLISVARADVEGNVYGPMNDVILLTKDILSVPRTVADFYPSLRKTFHNTVINNWNSIQMDEDSKKKFQNKIDEVRISNSNYNSDKPFLATGGQDYYNDSTFDDIELNDAIDVDSLPLSSDQASAIEEASNKASNLNENDFRKLINEMSSLSASLANDISQKNPLDEEWDILYSIQNSIMELKAFIADGSMRNSPNEASQNTDGLAIGALAYWQQNSLNNNIPFEMPAGKISVPFPFRSSLEELALQYLGDATRWTEIAALNGLQYPYVDEDGFTYDFINNGSGRSFNVKSGDNLYVGQVIYLFSSMQNTEKRYIRAINKISDTNYQIIVDGAENLERFLTFQNAKMRAFLPYTTNSMKEIYIPTSVPTDIDSTETKPISFIEDDPDFVKFSKVDFLLDDKMDLAITSDGFLNLAYGKANLVQAAKLKVLTAAGSLLFSPQFGSGVEIGQSVADINLDALVKNLNSNFTKDPRYDTPSSIDLEMDGNSLKISIVAKIKHGNGILPITIPLSK